MESHFDTRVKGLYDDAYKIISAHLQRNHKADDSPVLIPDDFATAFYGLVDQVNASLLEDTDNFYGYFLFQMSREIKFNISSPTAVNFKRSTYVIHFNPIIFLTLTLPQMETTIKHEILHIVSRHLLRANEYKAGYKKVAITMAMDVVVNTYLEYRPPYAITLEWVNLNYSLKLLPFESFEYYLEQIQVAVDLLDVVEDDAADDTDRSESIKIEFNPETTHDSWNDSSDIDEETLSEFTGKYMEAAQKGTVPTYLAHMLAALRNSQAELPWNLYLKRLMGTVTGQLKKTATRKNRRQPDRLDLQGQLRSHIAKIVVALDISGSITDEEFNQAIKEVFGIVKNYKHELTVVECDSEIRRVYTVKSPTDIKDRLPIRGGTRFSPVFEYANTQKITLLVYFTDGKGEEELVTAPRGYKTLWVISGRGDKLSVKEPYGVVKKLNAVEIQENAVRMHDVVRDGYSMNNHEKIHI